VAATRGLIPALRPARVDAADDEVVGMAPEPAPDLVLVAALGIVNTLTMGVVERVREIGVLRAIGMTRAQASRMVVVEAGILGLVGSVLGAVAGLAAGLVLLVLSGSFGPWVGLPWPSIGVAAILGIIGPALAAWYPSRLASRVSIVRALAFE